MNIIILLMNYHTLKLEESKTINNITKNIEKYYNYSCYFFFNINIISN